MAGSHLTCGYTRGTKVKASKLLPAFSPSQAFTGKIIPMYLLQPYDKSAHIKLEGQLRVGKNIN